MKPQVSCGDQDRYHLALAAAHMGTWDWDLTTGSIWWDDQMHRLLGMKPGAFGGHLDDFLNLIHPEDRDGVREQISHANQDFDGELRAIWTQDGSEHFVRMRSQTFLGDHREPLRVIGVAWDITDRRRTELALASERRLLSMLMAHLPDHIYFKDKESRFIAVNQSMAKCFGKHDSADMLRLRDHDFFTAEHADAAFQDEQRIIATGEPIINHEERETWPNRPDTWVSTTKMPLKDVSGEILGTFGLSRDITARKLADEQLRKMADELRAKNEALQEDLEMARELQNALLPQRFPHFPPHATEQESAVRFYHYFQPSMIVSGDFFDVLEISDNEAGLFICDVMGHGVRAALVAATIRALMGELRPFWNEPATLLRRLNLALMKALGSGSVTLFASAFYVVADLGRGEFRYANAGHPHPLRLAHDPAKGIARPLPLNGCRPGPALGIFANADYRTQRCLLSPRDVLLLFTDGLFEVEGVGGRTYDYQQLSTAVGARTRMPTRELCHSLIADVRQFSANLQFNDDVCLVAMDIDRLKS